MALPWDAAARNRRAQNQNVINRLRAELNPTGSSIGGNPRQQTGTIEQFGGKERATGFLDKYDTLVANLGAASRKLQEARGSTGKASVGSGDSQRGIYVGASQALERLNEARSELENFTADGLNTSVERFRFFAGRRVTNNPGANLARDLNQQATDLGRRIDLEQRDQQRAQDTSRSLASAVRPRARDVESLNASIGRGLRRRRSGQGNAPLRASLLDNRSRRVL